MREITGEIREYAARICSAFDKFKAVGKFRDVYMDKCAAVFVAQSWQDDIALL
jgi:hypothetical protein